MASSITKAARTLPTVLKHTRFTTRAFTTTPQRHDTVLFQVDGKGTGVAQHISVVGSPHSIQTDTYKAFGGNETAPSPLHFNLAALSSCTQVTGSIVAKDLGIKVENWQVAVDGELDPAVLTTGAEGNANWKGVVLKAKVSTDASGERFEELTREIERRCPVTQLFKRSGATFKSEWENVSK